MQSQTPVFMFSVPAFCSLVYFIYFQSPYNSLTYRYLQALDGSQPDTYLNVRADGLIVVLRSFQMDSNANTLYRVNISNNLTADFLKL